MVKTNPNLEEFNLQHQRIYMIRKLVLFTITIVFLLCPKVEANQHSVSIVKESIVKHSLELGIDPALALSIAKSESGFRHEARSSHGAVGVFQLMPSTARRLGVDPYCLSGNIKGGLMYYKKLYNMFGSTELALAAYNAGPGVVKRYHRVPPYGETQHFVSNIMREYNRQKTNPDPAILKARNVKPAKKTIETITKKEQTIIPEMEQSTPEAPIPTQGIV
jgi:hypothetical protein